MTRFMSPYRKILFVASTATIAMGQALAIEVPIPEGATTSWVAEQIVQNGVPTEIQAISYPGGTEELMAFYRGQWESTDEGAGFREAEVGQWTMISRKEGNELAVVQVAEDASGNTAGYISVARYAGSVGPVEAAATFPKIGGTNTVSATESEDFGKRATTMVFSNDASIGQNAAFYRRELETLGWSLAHDTIQEDTQVLFFVSKVGQLELAISQAKAGSTIIFSNMVEE